VAPPLPFPPLKFQLKMAYYWGKWQGLHLSESWMEHICSAPKISFFVRLRTLAAAAFFGYLFFAVEKK
jgi:hypothetical protein